MYPILKKLFRIYEGEGPKVLQFMLLAMLVQIGLSIGITASDSLFLTNVGAQRLPVIYLLIPVVMLVYIPLFSFLTEKYGIDKVFSITLWILIAGGAALWAAVAMSASLFGTTGSAVFVFYAAKLYAALWYTALYTLTWNFIDNYFDILDAKRLFPLFSGGMAFGSIIGGCSVTLLVTFMSVEQLYLVWALIALMTFPVLMLLKRKWKRIGDEEVEIDRKEATLGEQLSTIGAVLRTSAYTNLMIMVSLATFVITTLCEYQYMTVFEQGRSAEQVASLFGGLNVIVSSFNLVVSLFLFNRLVAWIGVRNTALIQPIVYTFTFSYFLLDYGMGAAVAGFFAYQGVLTSVEFNNQNFLFNALPSRAKATIRTFIEGLCEPVSTAIAGGFLMLAAAALSPQSLSLAGLIATLVGLSIVLGLRSQYLTAMIRNLRESWLDFSGKGTDLLAGLGPHDLRVLEETVKLNDQAQVIPAIRILWLNDRMAATVALLAYIDRSTTEAQRAAKPLVEVMLEEGDAQVYRRVLIWLERAKSKLDPLLLEEFGRHNLLSKEDVTFLMDTGAADNQLAAAAALWDTWSLEGNREGIGIIFRMLNGKDSERMAAIRLIGESNRPRYAHFLARFLKHPSPHVRKQALIAMNHLADASSYRLLGDFLRTIGEGDRATRLIALTALSKIGDVECIEPLIRMSELFTPSERRHTEAIIMKIGLQSVPVLISLVRDPRCPYQGRSIAIRALGKLAFPQLQTLAPKLVDSEIRRAYEFLSNHWILSKEKSDSVALQFLSGFYRDAQVSVVNFVLELLAISGRLPDFEMLTASLRSQNVKERGNAIETIEQGCSRAVFSILLPLVDSRRLADRVEFSTKTLGVNLSSAREVLMGAVDSTVQFECAGGIQAVWDLANAGGNPRTDCAPICAIMQKKLTEPSMNIVKEVIFALLERDHAPAAGARQSLNVLERAHSIASTEFFGSFAIPELAAIARDTGETYLPAGRKLYSAGEPAVAAYVVVSGEVNVRRADGTVRTAGVRAVLGSESLIGRRDYRDDAVSSGAVVLAIPTDVIMETAMTREPFAVGLLAKKLGTGL
ncbi:MAG: hypothetical protein C0404_04965 [Verrucomicrobia bacterium]|nr:hypothetical protein [Verrucomicrobiota bacterium]